MKKSVKIFVIFLVACIVFSTAGGIMLVSGGVKNFDKIFDELNIDLDRVFDYLTDAEELHTYTADEKDFAEITNISEIEIGKFFCKTTVESTAPGEKVSVSLKGEYETFGEEYHISVENAGGRLIIGLDGYGFNRNINLGNLFNYPDVTDLELKILIPEDYKGKIFFKDAAGEITASLGKLQLEEIKLNDCAGEVSVNVSDDCKTNLTVEDIAGDIKAKGGFNNVKLSDTVSNIDVTVTSVFEKISVSDTIGDVNVFVPADTRGTINLRNTLGDFKSDFNVKRSGKVNFSASGTMNGGGSSEFTAEDTIGDISLKTIK